MYSRVANDIRDNMTKKCVTLPVEAIDDLPELFEMAKENGFEAVELRLDWLESLDTSLLPRLKELRLSSELPMILAIRPERFKGKFEGDDKKRIDFLVEAAKIGFDYIELESDLDPELIDAVKSVMAAKNEEAQAAVDALKAAKKAQRKAEEAKAKAEAEAEAKAKAEAEAEAEAKAEAEAEAELEAEVEAEEDAEAEAEVEAEEDAEAEAEVEAEEDAEAEAEVEAEESAASKTVESDAEGPVEKTVAPAKEEEDEAGKAEARAADANDDEDAPTDAEAPSSETEAGSETENESEEHEPEVESGDDDDDDADDDDGPVAETDSGNVEETDAEGDGESDGQGEDEDEDEDASEGESANKPAEAIEGPPIPPEDIEVPEIVEQKLIIATYDNIATPPAYEIINHMKRAYELGAWMAKGCYYARNYEDTASIIEACIKAKIKRHVFSVFGTGDFGEETLTQSRIMGCKFCYCALNEDLNVYPVQPVLETINDAWG